MTNATTTNPSRFPTRFAPGDACTHNGRPATVACVTHHHLTNTVRYSIFYTDDQGGTVLDLFGRVLSKAGA